MNGLTRTSQRRFDCWRDSIGSLQSPDEDTPSVVFTRNACSWRGPRSLPQGTRVWYKDNQKHRETGPAIERPNGEHEYWLNGWYYHNREDWEEAGGGGPRKELTLDL